MHATAVFHDGDGSYDDVEALHELDTGHYQIKTADLTEQLDNATITSVVATTNPISAELVHADGSGVVEDVKRIEEDVENPQTLIVTSMGGSQEQYELATITKALDEPKFDDNVFEEMGLAWTPYDPCPFCQSTTFEEHTIHRQRVDATANPPETKREERTADLHVACNSCGEVLRDRTDDVSTLVDET